MSYPFGHGRAAVLRAIRSGAETRAEIVEASGVSSVQVGRLLRMLAAAGTVTRHAGRANEVQRFTMPGAMPKVRRAPASTPAPVEFVNPIRARYLADCARHSSARHQGTA